MSFNRFATGPLGHGPLLTETPDDTSGDLLGTGEEADMCGLVLFEEGRPAAVCVEQGRHAHDGGATRPLTEEEADLAEARAWLDGDGSFTVDDLANDYVSRSLVEDRRTFESRTVVQSRGRYAATAEGELWATGQFPTLLGAMMNPADPDALALAIDNAEEEARVLMAQARAEFGLTG